MLGPVVQGKDFDCEPGALMSSEQRNGNCPTWERVPSGGLVGNRYPCRGSGGQSREGAAGR